MAAAVDGVGSEQLGDAAEQSLDGGVEAHPARRRYEDLVPPAAVDVERQVKQERASGTRAGAEDGLAEEDAHQLGAVERDVLGDEEAIHKVEQVVAVASLEQALELVGQGLLDLHAPDGGGAGVGVGVRVDELALLHGQVQPVVLGHVDPDADRHMILAADHVLEVQLVLVDMSCAVDLLLAAQPITPDVESDSRGVAGELTYPVQFSEHAITVDPVRRGKVEVVREPRPWQVALAQRVPALQGRPVGQAGLAEDPADNPPEHVVALDVRFGKIEGLGLY